MEVLEPISSTNTSLLAQSSPATITRQAALRNSSLGGLALDISGRSEEDLLRCDLLLSRHHLSYFSDSITRRPS